MLTQGKITAVKDDRKKYHYNKKKLSLSQGLQMHCMRNMPNLENEKPFSQIKIMWSLFSLLTLKQLKKGGQYLNL